ncbi:MAG: glycosyltransferase family 2 protein [Bacteroidia bacterium]|nr:glycosyltransferase family 2 protein [Bacteroidia bacterium]
MKISASIVLYNTPDEALRKAVQWFLNAPFKVKLFLIDNSPVRKESTLLDHPDIVYIFNNSNMGYGKAHNIALKKVVAESDYHMVLNPDIEMTNETLEACIVYMYQNVNIGLLMPKVLYPDGQLQYLCKMMPTPFDLIMRRFIPGFLKPVFQKRMDAYELKHKNFNETMEIPNLSGCFMLLRCEAIKTVGFFDENFFMYLEDTDLSRRINSQYQTIYYPKVSIIHHYEKGSYKNYKLLLYHIRSAFYYFSKWGWLLDSSRNTINRLLK